MNWLLFRWAWLLESPLFVGTTPAGSLNRCRLYVPARALWAALTAELARRKTSEFPSYQSAGKQLQEEARFTYLYPAEQIGDPWRAWLPRYEEGNGLIWRREDQQAANAFLALRQIRMRLLTTRPSTAIDPSCETAVEGTLRESECVNTHWHSEDGAMGSRVAMVGYVFLRDGSNMRSDLEGIASIMVGGDTRYGFGRLRRIALTQEQAVFGAQVELGDQDPIVCSEIVYAHATGAENLVGSREMLVGWDNAGGRGLFAQNTDPLWVPGATVAGGEFTCKWKVEQNGLWVKVQ